MTVTIRRRELLAAFGGAAAAWPLAARAQQAAMPVVGFIRPSRAEEAGHLVAAVRQGLREAGFPSDKYAIEARWANGRIELLPKLAAELIDLKVAAIVASVDPARAAKAATTSIPIIFVTGADPVAAGLVSSINRPGGNLTGVSFYDVPVTGKRLALLRELVPKAEIIAVMQDSNFSILEEESPGRSAGFSTRRSTTSSISISSATSRRSRASTAAQGSWWYTRRSQRSPFPN